MKWLTWPLRLIGFLLWYAWELVLSNAAVTRDVLTPGQGSSPIVVRYRTRCRSEFETVLLSVLITLTPGTLTLGAHHPGGGEGWEIVVHGMYFPDPDDLTASLHDMENHMLRAIRREGLVR